MSWVGTIYGRGFLLGVSILLYPVFSPYVWELRGDHSITRLDQEN